jgi:chitodextrinase
MPGTGPTGGRRAHAPPRDRQGERRLRIALGVAAIALGALALTGVALAAAPAHAPYRQTGIGPMLRTALGPSPRASVRPSAWALTANGLSPAAISLTWPATSDLFFTDYTVHESSAGPGGPWLTVGVITAQSTTEFAVAGLSPGATYWWQVNETGSLGGQSSTVLAQAQPGLAYLVATQLSGSSVNLSWTDNATYGGLLSFGSFVLHEEVNGGAPTEMQAFTSPSVRSYAVTGLAGGSSYLFFLNTTDCVNGCSTGTPSVTQSNVVAFGATLTLQATLAAGRTVVDVGQADYLTCTPSGGQPPYSFTWDFGNGTFVAGPASLAHAFPSPGAVIVTCRVLDSQKVVSTVATSVTVDPDPTLVIIQNRTAVDVGQWLGLSCAPSGGTAPFFVGWTFGDGGSATGTIADHAYATPGPYLALCTAEDGAGTIVAANAAVAVSPALAVGASVSWPSAAPGSAVRFTALPANGSGSYAAFRWDFGDGNTSSFANVSHAFGAAGNFTVRLSITDSNGATATGRVVVSVSPIRVSTPPAPRSVNEGATVAFSAAASGGAGGPYNFTWRFGDGSVGYGASASHRYVWAGTYSPVLVVTDRLGATVASSMGPVVVQAPTTALGWTGTVGVLFLPLLVGLAVGLTMYQRERTSARRPPPTVTGWLPAEELGKTAQGYKVCRACGAANLPSRRSCEGCGASLLFVRRTRGDPPGFGD